MNGEYIILKQNQYMRRFREAGATDPQHATPLSTLGVRNSFLFRRMVKRGVFVRFGDEAYYMDPAAAAEFVSRRRRVALFLVALILLAIFMIFLLKSGTFK
jgi:hypothetical protein